MDTQNLPSNQEPPPGVPAHLHEDMQQNRDVAALSYVWVLSVILYILKGRESPFIRFHSKQAMILFFLSVVCWFVPWVGKFLEFIVLAGMVMGFLSAAQGDWTDVPFIGPLSRGEASVKQTGKDIGEFCVNFFRRSKDLYQKDKKEKLMAELQIKSPSAPAVNVSPTVPPVASAPTDLGPQAK